MPRRESNRLSQAPPEQRQPREQRGARQILSPHLLLQGRYHLERSDRPDHPVGLYLSRQATRGEERGGAAADGPLETHQSQSQLPVEHLQLRLALVAAKLAARCQGSCRADVPENSGSLPIPHEEATARSHLRG